MRAISRAAMRSAPVPTTSTCVAPAIVAAIDSSGREPPAAAACAASIPSVSRRPRPAAAAGPPASNKAVTAAVTIGDTYPTVWHQLRSISTVATTTSVPAAAGEAALPVINAVRAPAARLAAIAAIVAVVAPSWLMPTTSPSACGSSEKLERLGRDRPATEQARGPPALAEDRGDRHRGVLGRAAPGDHDRLAAGRAGADRGGQPGRGSVVDQASRDAIRQSGFRRDHLGHGPRGPGRAAGVA